MPNETPHISLPEFAGLSELSRKFADYWLSLPKTELIPYRHDFHPEEIADILPCVVIHELVSSDFIKLRLAGTAVVDSYGQEITGKNYLDFVEEERRAKASEAIFLVCQQPSAMLVQIQSTTQKGTILTRESIAFPMRDDDGTPRFAYFCSSPTEQRIFGSDEDDKFQVMQVMKRTYADIGAGTPNFVD